MIIIEGRDKTVRNTVIEDNNFGGGTNVDRSIYLDNTDKSVIKRNHFVAVNVADIDITNKTRRVYISSDNVALTQLSNPRSDDLYSLKIINNSDKLMGYETQSELLGNWEGNNKIVQDENGIVHHLGEIEKGETDKNSTILILPKGFRPSLSELISVKTNKGFGLLKHDYNGRLSIIDLPSNENVSLLPFPASESDLANDQYKFYDTFTKNEFGVLDTGQTWSTINNNFQIVDNQLSLIDRDITDIAYVNTGLSNVTIQVRFTNIPENTRTNRLVFRMIDEENYLYLTARDIDGINYAIYQVVDGVHVQIDGTNEFGYKNGDVIRLWLDDENISYRVNNNPVRKKSIYTHINGTKFGVSLAKSTNAKIDNFGIKV